MPNVAPTFMPVETTITKVSTNSAGQAAAFGNCFDLTFSPDGTKIAFSSTAVNLVDGDTNNWFDVFVKDLNTGVVTRVSTDAAGNQGNYDSTQPVFLPGGTRIAFQSGASNLVPGDTNAMEDIFIKDLVTGAITRVSTNSDGSEFINISHGFEVGFGAPTFSPDGTKMAFSFNNGAAPQIFIKDLVTGTLTLAVDFSADQPLFSPDGTGLLYRRLNNFNGNWEILLKNLATGDVTLVSTGINGQPPNHSSEQAHFTPDGTRVVFSSGASNLVAGDTNNIDDIFVKDLISGEVTLVSITPDGLHSGANFQSAISPDGTKVAFTTFDMVSQDVNHYTDVYLKDLLTGEVTWIAVNAFGFGGPTGSGQPVFSPDGKSVGFYGDQLVSNDTGYYDLYLAKPTRNVRFVEGGPAVAVVPLARVIDANFTGGTLSVSIADAAAGDQLALALSNQPGHSIALAGNQVLVNGIAVGTLGSTATSLTISLNGNATSQVVEWLTEAVQISSTADLVAVTSRTIGFTLVDGGGTADGGADTTSFSVRVAFVPVDNEPGHQINGTPDADVLQGGSGNDVIDGGAGTDQLFGLAGNDLLNGGAGSDAMAGGKGNDVYLVDDAGDTISELAGEGMFDEVRTALPDYTLPANVENLTATGFGQILRGNALNNIITGTDGNDLFRLEQGGLENVHGGAGNDGFYFGATFTANDHVDGGAGSNDQIGLQGDYSSSAGGLALRDDTITGIEVIAVLPGFSYSIGTVDANVPAGGVLKIQATQLGPNDSLSFYGGQETDGSFLIYGGQGMDNMTGGAGNDGFYFGPGGFSIMDHVDGGGGTNDQLALDGDYTLELTFNVTNVEVLVMLHGPTGIPNHFNITSGDFFVGAGQTKTIFGLQVETAIRFDGSGEHDGAFKIYGGMAGDTLTGGDGNDWLFGSSGGDALTGGAGADTFFYDDASQSTSLGYDRIIGFDDSVDHIDLPFAVTGLAGPASGSLNTASFNADLAGAFAGLTGHQAGVYTATSGDLAGHAFLVIDADGVQGYQAGSDYVIEIVAPPTPVDNPAIFV